MCGKEQKEILSKQTMVVRSESSAEGGPERKIPVCALEVLKATELNIHGGFQQLRHLLNNKYH